MRPAVSPRFRSFLLSGLGLAVLSACMADPEDARMDVPGDYLGTFQVDAVLSDSTCGDGTLAAPGLWDFEVRLSKDDSHLYWTNGAESIRGDLSSDGKAFTFKSEVATTLSESKPGRPGCVIWRQDAAAGSLEPGSKEDEFPAFTGKLTYSYAPGVGSQCGELLDATGLTSLPCLIRYEMTGTRKDD